MAEKGKDDEDRHFLLPLLLELRNVPSLHELDNDRNPQYSQEVQT